MGYLVQVIFSLSPTKIWVKKNLWLLPLDLLMTASHIWSGEKKIMKFCNFGLFKAFEESYLFVMSRESKLTYFMTK